MVRASEVEGREVSGLDGSALGTLEKLLLHPDGTPVVVGAAMRPPAALVVVSRPETYLPLSALRFSKTATSTTLVKLPRSRDSVEPLGANPDLTVIWSGMPIEGPSSEPVGKVADFEFDPGSGAVLRLEADGGAVANAAYGRLDVPAEAIVGYSAGAVHLSKTATDLEATGGMAKAAATALAGAAEAVSAASEAAGNAVVGASGAAGRAIKAAKDSKIAERAAHKAGKTWRDSVKAFRDGMTGE